MNQLEKFWKSVKEEEAALLATSAQNSVTMRTISPVYHEDAILLFTSPESQKYLQLKENPLCVVAVGGAFMEAKACILGETMSEKNAALREVFTSKYSDAFDESAAYGGREAEFIILQPTKIKGWGFENDMPTGPFEYDF